ncbi:hypothetical protein BBD42_16720 [Paenibacillus sp. BIHB 4019]|uniref:O-antigen ligase-related domain-containing protein n=1 Tax=Paenibacillus sp. BIHB 4019 TaxID=1870819 RepID=A0A1B2DJM9_9BACL|nr:O-antigen ligase family protein [Paenibacillus sp. BIHB 4019]ANY67932.1 hypothetical protein BBD42_16720 [Paenibacillus sp. BIHB 4019]
MQNSLIKSAGSFNIAIFLIALLPVTNIIKGGSGTVSPVMDITLLSYIALYIICFFKVLFHHAPIHFVKSDFITLFWSAVVLISVLYSEYTVFAIGKMSRFILFSVGLMLISRIVMQTKEDIDKLLAYILYSWFGVELYIIIDFVLSGAPLGRYAFFNVHPLPMAMTGVVVLLLAFIQLLQQKINSLLAIIIISSSLMCIIISASRGPLVALLLTLVMLLPLILRKLKLKLLVTLGFSVVLLSQLPFVKNQFDYFYNRLMNSAGDDDQSGMRRYFIQDLYMDSFYDNPLLGAGINGVTPVVSSHNMFIDVLGENGGVLFLILVVMVALFIIDFIKTIWVAADYTKIILVSLLMLNLWSLQFSWSYTENKYFFVILAAYFTYGRIMKSTKKSAGSGAAPDPQSDQTQPAISNNSLNKSLGLNKNLGLNLRAINSAVLQKKGD